MSGLLGYLVATSAVAAATAAAAGEVGQHVAAMYDAINAALRAAGAGG